MIWPFENDTVKVEKKLAKRSLAAERRRNLIAVITIGLSVCLMALIAFVRTAVNEQTAAHIRGQYQAGCAHLSYDDIDRLVSAGKFEKWGFEGGTGNIHYQDANLSVKFYDEGMRNLMDIAGITGEYPRERNEICVERGFLKYFTLPEEIGQTLLFDLGGGEQSYTVSGILETENKSRQFELYISESLAAEKGEKPFDIRFRLAGDYTGQPEQLREDIQAFFQEMGVPEEETFFSSTYFDLSSFYMGSDMPVYAVAVLIAIACSAVIYNIFYISVMGKLREYGRLKVIGTTPRQLRQVVKQERRVLMWAGILSGLLAAVILSNLLYPGYWNWSKNLQNTVVVVLLAMAVVIFSTQKPLRMAAKVSAIEAMRSSGCQDVPKASRSLRRPLSIFRLACMNFTRSRRKAALTLFSLGMTGIMTMCIAAYASSVNIAEIARRNFGDGGEYTLAVEDLDLSDDFAQAQRQELLGEDTREKLLTLPGVDYLTYYSSVYCTMAQSPKAEWRFLVGGFTAEQTAAFQEADAVLEGTVNYDELLKNNGIIVIRDSENMLKKLYHVEFSIGDTVTLQSLDGYSKDYTVMGIVDSFQNGSGTMKALIVPEEELHTLYPDIEDFTGYINVHATQTSDEQRRALYDLLDDPRIMIISLDDIIAQTQTNLRLTLMLLYGLAVFIALFALINLINTLITNLLTRQQEFGILQSVGMTSRQLSRMVSGECLCYIGATLLITLTIGTACGIAAVQVFNQLGLFGQLTYHFPVLVMMIFSAALLAVYGMFRLMAVRFLQKQSLVERIKTTE